MRPEHQGLMPVDAPERTLGQGCVWVCGQEVCVGADEG